MEGAIRRSLDHKGVLLMQLTDRPIPGCHCTSSCGLLKSGH